MMTPTSSDLGKALGTRFGLATPHRVLTALAGAVLILNAAATAGTAQIQREEIHDPHAPAEAVSPGEPRPPKAGQPINDRELYAFLDIQGRQLLDAGRTLTNWTDKLGYARCGAKIPSPPTRAHKTVDVARRLESAVAVVGVFFKCDKCENRHMSTAAGFFVTSSGALATCGHVLANFSKNGLGVAVLTRDGRVYGVRDVIASDPANDLVVLQLAVEGGKFTPLALSPREPDLGSPVLVLSHPEQHFYTLTTGVVARRSFQSLGSHLRPSLGITADFAKGSSGAPVCNEAGAVIGMVNNTESIYYNVENGQPQNLQMVLKNCTPAAPLADLLKKNQTQR